MANFIIKKLTVLPITKAISFHSFLNATASDVSLIKTETKNIIEHFLPHVQLMSRFVAATFVVDFSNQRYLYMEDSVFNITGYSAEHFLENGLEASLNKWHPADLNLVNLKLWPDNLSFFKTVASEEYANYITSFNYRMRNAKGNYVVMLQRFSYIPGAQADLPAGVIGVAFDITHYKLSSKQIADKLLVSESTIVNHRKTCWQKQVAILLLSWYGLACSMA